MPKARTATATIASGASLSGAVCLSAGTLTGIQLPSAWTTADLTFQGSADGVAYANVYDQLGNEATITSAGASTYVPLGAFDFAGLSWLKVRSGTSGTPVVQAAARSILLQNKVYR
jgi:hypothetical protein